LRSHRRARAGSPLRAATFGALVLGVAFALPAPAFAASPGTATPARHRHQHRLRLVVRRAHYDVGSGGAVTVRGVLLPRARRRIVIVEAALGGRWRPLSHARTRRNGHFHMRFPARWVGVARLRIAARGGLRADAGIVRAYRPTVASWYSLYGSALACGGTLGYEQLGVANKTLPCGTKVTLRYRGRVVTVRVIDRGPYVAGREWDLTGATARRLGFEGVGVVWSTR
jgi:peptidoglycan lytic transglycosylase